MILMVIKRIMIKIIIMVTLIIMIKMIIMMIPNGEDGQLRCTSQ